VRPASPRAAHHGDGSTLAPPRARTCCEGNARRNLSRAGEARRCRREGQPLGLRNAVALFAQLTSRERALVAAERPASAPQRRAERAPLALRRAPFARQNRVSTDADWNAALCRRGLACATAVSNTGGASAPHDHRARTRDFGRDRSFVDDRHPVASARRRDGHRCARRENERRCAAITTATAALRPSTRKKLVGERGGRAEGGEESRPAEGRAPNPVQAQASRRQDQAIESTRSATARFILSGGSGTCRRPRSAGEARRQNGRPSSLIGLAAALGYGARRRQTVRRPCEDGSTSS